MSQSAQMLKLKASDELLTKWPRLVVAGESVTEKQANEILIRTDSMRWHTNDRDWSRTVSQITGVPQLDWQVKRDVQDIGSVLEAQVEARHRLGYIDLQYLSNHRIASTWIGGPHGWCRWDGKIGSSKYNVGKWPKVEEVDDEWSAIAEAFPYLELSAQLVTNEGYGFIAAQWDVSNGEAQQVVPGPLLSKLEEYQMTGQYTERGVSPERLREAVVQVLHSVAAGESRRG